MMAIMAKTRAPLLLVLVISSHMIVTADGNAIGNFFMMMRGQKNQQMGAAKNPTPRAIGASDDDKECADPQALQTALKQIEAAQRERDAALESQKETALKLEDLRKQNVRLQQDMQGRLRKLAPGDEVALLQETFDNRLQQEIFRKDEEIAKEKATHESTVRELNERIGHIENALSSTKRELSEANKAKMKYERDVQTLSDQIGEKERGWKEHMKDAEENNKQHVQILERYKEESDKLVEQAREEGLAELVQEREKVAHLQTLQSDLQGEKNDLEARLLDMLTKHEISVKEAEETAHKVTKLGKRIDELGEEKSILIAEKKSLSQRIELLQADYDSLSEEQKDKEELSKSTNYTLRRLEKENSILVDEKNATHRRYSAMDKKHQETVEELEEALAAQVRLSAAVETCQQQTLDVKADAQEASRLSSESLDACEKRAADIEREAEDASKRSSESLVACVENTVELEKNAHEALRQSADSILALEHAAVESTRALEESEKEVIGLQADIQALSVQSAKDLQACRDEGAEDVRLCQNECQATVAEVEKRWENRTKEIIKEFQEEAQQMEQEAEEASLIAAQQLEACERDADDSDRAWQGRVESLNVSSQNALDSMAKDHRAAMDALRSEKDAAAKKQIDELTTEHVAVKGLLEEDVKKRDDGIRSLEKAKEELANELSDTRQKHGLAAKDAKYWEEKFVRRGYVNFTHLMLDASVAGNAAALTANEYLQEKGNVIRRHELYKKYLERHVDAAAVLWTPIHRKYVVPVWDKVKVALTEASDKTLKFCGDRYIALVKGIKRICRKGESKDGKVAIPDSVCRNPEGHVTFLFCGAFVLFVILAQRPILRLARGTISLFVGILWFFCPLRWLLLLFTIGASSTSHPKKEESPSSPSVSQQQPRQQKTEDSNGQKTDKNGGSSSVEPKKDNNCQNNTAPDLVGSSGETKKKNGATTKNVGKKSTGKKKGA